MARRTRGSRGSRTRRQGRRRARLVDGKTVGFVVARVAEDVGDAEPIAELFVDEALGWKHVNPQANAFERDVLRADDYGVPGLIEVFYCYCGVDQ